MHGAVSGVPAANLASLPTCLLASFEVAAWVFGGELFCE